MEAQKIPFNRPAEISRVLDYLTVATRSSHHSGDGPFTKKCHSFFEKTLGVPKALLTTSCTHALEMTGLLLDIEPGDEVIVPSFTFVSSINAYVLRGAKPVFCDVRPDTLNLDETMLERLITPKTKAIVVVHYAGVACEMDSILKVAQHHQIPVIEDNAHGLFGKYKGRNLGTMGALSTLSFHETKNISCGEGGALLINDPRFSDRAEIIREKGTNRSRFFRGQVDKYSWVSVGSSYLPSDLLAAALLAQLESAEEIQLKRKKLWETYYSELKSWASSSNVRLPIIPEDCEQAYHMFYMLLPSLERRQQLIQHLKDAGISAVFHYLPLHLSEMGVKFGGKAGDCPVTEDISDRLIRLPFFYNLDPEDQGRIISTILRLN